MFIRSALLDKVPGIRHGFGTREEPVPGIFLRDWEKARPIWKQVHQTDSCELLGPGQRCGNVDSLWTRAAGAPLPIMTADCVPVLLARADGRAVAGAHAGWRGTRAGILKTLWQRLRIAGEDPRDWVAAIGPAIGPCCYEVSEELAIDFEREFARHGPGLAVPRPRFLDLPAINAAELREIGLQEVELLRHCTRCEGAPRNPVFHSYRREGTGTRQFSIAEITG